MNAWLDVMMVPQVRPFSGEAVARVGSSKPSPYVAPGEAASIMARAPQGALTHRPNRYVQSSPWKTVTTSALTLDFRVESGPACTGTIGLAPSANLNPERAFPSLFEPVHGSAPDIHGRNIANPVAMIWSAALMLDFLGEREAHDAVLHAIERVLVDGPRTPDLGGSASTTEVGQA